jgi:hypothetical protein
VPGHPGTNGNYAYLKVEEKQDVCKVDRVKVDLAASVGAKKASDRKTHRGFEATNCNTRQLHN